MNRRILCKGKTILGLILALTIILSSICAYFVYDKKSKASQDEKKMEQIKSARPTSAVLQMFADAKLDEVVLIYSKATSQEKQDGYKKLSNLYPALTTRMESLKK